MPMLPGFHLPKRGRKPHSQQQKFARKITSLRQNSFKQIGEIFGQFIPTKLLKQDPSGKMSRRRLFTKENTFWSFLGQVLDADGGCREAVKKLQSYASNHGLRLPSSSTASYCCARKKLDENLLVEVFQHTAKWSGARRASHSLNDRQVIVVDGTGVTMADTAENQELWPQSSNQKPGCGFPSARICAYFSLQTGTMLSYAIGNKKSNELPLFRKQWSTFEAGDIFLGDKGFCSYFDLAELKKRCVDSVITLARRKPVGRKNCIKEFAPDDLLIEWKKPVYREMVSYSRKTWEDLPDKLVMRQIKVKVTQSGFRTKEFHIVTTLIDQDQYLKDEIAALYLKRWDVELFFRDIKTTMGFDILRCQSPEMIKKEILMYFIAYNCIRRIMLQATQLVDIDIRSISFKGSLQAIRSWEPRLGSSRLSTNERQNMLSDLSFVVARCKVFDRPGRSDPRCLKRRPKPYQLLNKPRSEMVEIQHRSRYEKKA
ncbi:IS4 family transposase [Desulfosediminicola ganghwensis]|uniref:IS4 family transposase n=1 Tax=Desulfosediminicola ganghwensis TaxID=2569540 RepID=UPI001C3D90E7|nr:IS4 family transposase [Desulfosediminicola ganghwensis]